LKKGWRLYVRLARRDDAVREWLDASSFETKAIEENLRDIRFINHVLGWTAFTTRQVLSVARALGPVEVRVLDIASGSADIPLAVVRQARRAGINLTVVVSDISPQIVEAARRPAAKTPSIVVEKVDALNLPYAPGSFDIVLCTLALHHFGPDEAVVLLQNMARVGRRVLVFDLARSPLAYAGAVLLTRLLPMNAMTRHDAPVSVRRAYTVAEVRDLVTRAGLRREIVHPAFPFRLVVNSTGRYNEERNDAPRLS